MEQKSPTSKPDAMKCLDGLFCVVEAARMTKQEHVQLDGMYKCVVGFIDNAPDAEPEKKPEAE